MTRRNPEDPHAWAMAYRNIAGRPFQNLHALAEIARDLHPRVVVQKSAQVGLTELAVNLALWAADLGYAQRGNVLFLMPTQNQMADFAQQRFDRAIQDSPYLRSRLQPEPPARKGADSKRLKHLGLGWIFLRAAESRRQIASVDADLVILDEFDQMDQVLDLAEKRLASSRKPLLRVISTPRLPETGVNGLYLASDQRRYYLPCPKCGLEQPLTWQVNVDIERALLICRACRATMKTQVKGRWVAEAPGNGGEGRFHGYHLSRLYSPWLNLQSMIEASQANTPWALQEFHNSDLGETFVPPGGGLQPDEIDQCRDDYDLDSYAGQSCIMGVDVGTLCHVVIRESPPAPRLVNGRWQRPQNHVSRLWWVGTPRFDELQGLVKKFHVSASNIDLQPETLKATEFARDRKNGKTFLTDYNYHEPGHRYERGSPRRISANRTHVMDEVVARFRRRQLSLPRNARDLLPPFKNGFGEYYRELMAPKRTLISDSNGNPTARWLEKGQADHFFHAEVYCMLAQYYLRSEVIEPAW